MNRLAPYSVLLHKVDEGRPLNLHRLPVPVVHGQDKVEEVGLSEVGRRLLLKVRPSQTNATVRGRKGKCGFREGWAHPPGQRRLAAGELIMNGIGGHQESMVAFGLKVGTAWGVARMARGGAQEQDQRPIKPSKEWTRIQSWRGQTRPRSFPSHSSLLVFDLKKNKTHLYLAHFYIYWQVRLTLTSPSVCTY